VPDGEEKKEYKSLIEFFYEYLLPLAITFGMPIREFWEEEPELLWAYRKSYIEKMKMQKEFYNFNDWLQGLYIYDAVNKAIYNNFNNKNKIQTYMKKPIDFSKTSEELEKEKIKEMEEKIKNRNKEIKKMLNKK